MANKGVDTIQYNLLNLPQEIVFANGDRSLYKYNAAGKKYQVIYCTHIDNELNPIQGNGVAMYDTLTYDYDGSYVYRDHYFNMLMTPDGYVHFNEFTGEICFYAKDHLGNNRATYYVTPMAELGVLVKDIINYYPYGMEFNEKPAVVYAGFNPELDFTYNGKEFQTMHGLNMLDYGARFIDMSKPDWIGLDLLCEKYYSISPYAYCAGNPVNRFDPDGKQVILGGPALNIGMNKVVATIINNSDLQDGYILGSALLSPITGNEPSSFEITTDEFGVFNGVVFQPASSNDVEAAKSSLLLPIISGSAVNKIEKSIENVVEGGRAGKTIVKENGVIVKSYGSNDAHKPAHAHVLGGGKDVRVGPNGKPLKGQPELSDKQKKVIDNNRKEIRKEVNAVGKENKKIEEQNLRK